jgi:hypothetical protein
MSVVTDILDRLSGVAALKERVVELTTQLGDLRRVMLEQQKDFAEVKGQLKGFDPDAGQQEVTTSRRVQ